ncbi:MAG: hypothetical protein VKJ04_09615 [Vampirovibrionales bacterium]|nr:hypothetical protein [Vampirovibrionales bacterium]
MKMAASVLKRTIFQGFESAGLYSDGQSGGRFNNTFRAPYSAGLALSVLLLIVSVGSGTPAFAQYQSLPPMPNSGESSYSTYGNNNAYQPPTQQPYQQQNQYQYNNDPYANQQYQQPYNSYNNPSPQNQTYQGRVSTVPAGTTLSATVSAPLSSEFSRVGDRFAVALGSPISAGDGSIAIPAGSQIEGQVVRVQPAGRTGRSGELEIRFNTAVLPSGQRVPLSASIQTEDGTGVIKGSTTAGRVGGTALKTGLGAGLGAALGTAMGPLSGGGVGRGAIYGTAIGGGAGLAKALWDKGKEAVLQSGEPISIKLDSPLSVTPQGNAYGSGYNNNAYQNNSYQNYNGSGNGAFTPYGGQSNY